MARAPSEEMNRVAHTSGEAVKKPSSWISATLAFENLSIRRLHAIYEAPRYILLHRQNSRLGIFTASFSEGSGFWRFLLSIDIPEPNSMPPTESESISLTLSGLNEAAICETVQAGVL